MDKQSQDKQGQLLIVGLVQIFTFISLVACSWMLSHLLRRRRALYHCLMWLQFVALVSTDWIWALSGIALNGLGIYSFLPPATTDRCLAVLCLRQTLEFSACLLEVQIAAGYAITAAIQSTWAVKMTCTLLRWSILLSWPCAAAVFIATSGSLDVSIRSIGSPSAAINVCDVKHNDGWDFVVLLCCGLSIVFYASVISTYATSSPNIVQNRTRSRMAWYVACFTVSFGVKAFQDIFHPGFNHLSVIAWLLLCLRGAFNALNYGFQSPWQASSQTGLAFEICFSENHSILEVSQSSRAPISNISCLSSSADSDLASTSRSMQEPVSVRNEEVVSAEAIRVLVMT